MKSLLALLAIGVIILVPCSGRGAEAPYQPTPEVRIQCRPPVLYRGDDLVVELSSPHDNFDFGISPAAVHSRDPDELFLLSFEPGRNDHIAPVIPPQKFALMHQITLNTATARGSLSNWWRGDEVPRVLKPPELIFTDFGLYQILLGRGLGSEDPAVSECSVDYVNQRKLPGAALETAALYGVRDSTFHHDICGARTFETAVSCPATTVYRGETLALDLVSDHPAGRIGIVDPDWNIYLLPAEKNAGRGAPPGIRIVAGSETAVAYSYESAASYGVPSVDVQTKSGRAFTKSGWYIAISVPGPQCEAVTDVGACWIHYVDAPPPPQ